MLKLEIERKGLQNFCDIKIGTIFKYDTYDEYFMKTDPKYAYSFNGNSQNRIGDFTQVKVLDATLYIKDN